MLCAEHTEQQCTNNVGSDEHSGEVITIRVAFKPTSTIGQKQKTVSRDGVDVDLIARGRHDPCVVPRAVPMVEAMVAIVLADQLLRVRYSEFVRKRDAAGTGSGGLATGLN